MRFENSCRNCLLIFLPCIQQIGFNANLQTKLPCARYYFLVVRSGTINKKPRLNVDVMVAMEAKALCNSKRSAVGCKATQTIDKISTKFIPCLSESSLQVLQLFKCAGHFLCKTRCFNVLFLPRSRLGVSPLLSFRNCRYRIQHMVDAM